jgi:hypothetical protein
MLEYNQYAAQRQNRESWLDRPKSGSISTGVGLHRSSTASGNCLLRCQVRATQTLEGWISPQRLRFVRSQQGQAEST